MIAGGYLSGAAQLAAAWLYFGSAPLHDWMRALLNVRCHFPLLEHGEQLELMQRLAEDVAPHL